MNSIVPYEGTQPYVFLSYAHADAPAVMQIASHLQAAGCRIWYDGGIEVGSEWPEYIAAHLNGAAVMLAFLSNAYVRSDNCRKELHYAQTHKIRTVNIFLEETALTPGMEMQIGPLFALMKYSMGEKAFYDKLLKAPQIAPLLSGSGAGAPGVFAVQGAVRKKRWTWQKIIGLCAALALLIACAVLFIVGYSTGYVQRLYIQHNQAEITTPPGETEVRFTSTQLESAARSYTGIPEGALHVSDLAGLRELALDGETEQTLAQLRYFPDLKHLTLTGMQAENLKALPACGIEILTLRNCRLTSLKGIGKLTFLRELDCEDCPIRSLGDLSYCLQLRRLRLKGAQVHSFSALRPLTVLAEAELSNCSINELRPLMRLSRLTDLRFTDCDLRGSFFKHFDREWDIVTLSLVDCELNSTKNLEDFTGLRELTLIRSGDRLDWSALAKIASLRLVTADETMEPVLREALTGSGLAQLNIIPAEDAS